jgi:hypothetical protein
VKRSPSAWNRQRNAGQRTEERILLFCDKCVIIWITLMSLSSSSQIALFSCKPEAHKCFYLWSSIFTITWVWRLVGIPLENAMFPSGRNTHSILKTHGKQPSFLKSTPLRHDIIVHSTTGSFGEEIVQISQKGYEYDGKP